MKTKFLIISNLFFLALFLFAFKNAQENKELNLCNTGIAVELMNKIYIGIENPIRIASPNMLPLEAIRTTNCEIKANENCNEFLLTATELGKSEIVIHKYGKALKGSEKEEELLRFEFRNIMLPDPIISLKERFEKGNIRSGEMKAQQGLIAGIPGIDARVKTESFKVTLERRRDENPYTFINKGARFKGVGHSLILSCQPGDVIHFQDIRVKCPADKIAREIAGFSLKVK